MDTLSYHHLLHHRRHLHVGWPSIALTITSAAGEVNAITPRQSPSCRHRLLPRPSFDLLLHLGHRLLRLQFTGLLVLLAQTLPQSAIPFLRYPRTQFRPHRLPHLHPTSHSSRLGTCATIAVGWLTR